MKHPLQAILFDMDDTLVATTAIWRGAEEHLLQALGHPGYPLYRDCKGMNALDIATTAYQLFPSEGLTEAACRHIMRTRLLENFRSKPILEMPGAVALVRRCATLSIPLAVASGSPAPAIQSALQSLGIYEFMQTVISSESVACGKPHPDVFLATAEALSIRPEACLVFEDSPAGVKAAVAAGMRCIVCPSLPDDQSIVIADRIVSHWDEVGVEDLFLG